MTLFFFNLYGTEWVAEISDENTKLFEIIDGAPLWYITTPTFEDALAFVDGDILPDELPIELVS